jgi:hypothetical protein
VGAIRRGAVVAQLLGGYDDGARRGLRVLTVQPDDDAYCLYVHDIEDVGGPDLDEFPPWSESGDDGDATVCSETPDALLSYAEQQLGADPGRWINLSMLDDEYDDFVYAGRPVNLKPPE